MSNKISKIKKLKNFGIFKNFLWHSDVPDFKQFNLIYGWNRSGKTTFSRIFAACQKKTIAFKEYPENGEFELKKESGSIIKSDAIQSCSLPIKVFNQDFIRENISFDNDEKHCNPIVYVSEQDIESKNKLDKLKEEKRNLDKAWEDSLKDKNIREKREDDFRISIAREISNLFFWKSYNKSDVKNRIEDVVLDNFKKLSDEDFEKKKKAINSEIKQKQEYVPEYSLDFNFDGIGISDYKSVGNVLKRLLSKRIVSEAIERLKNDNELNIWVKQGFDLHKKKDESEKCLFCEKTLDKGFLETLSKHFSEDYEVLQQNIRKFIDLMNGLKREKRTGNYNLYTDVQKDYQKAITSLNLLIDDLNKWIDEAIRDLEEKSKKPLSDIKLSKEPEEFSSKYNAIVVGLNKTIRAHNDKVDNHDKEINAIKKQVEHHLIAVAIEEQDYKRISTEYLESTKKEIEHKKKSEENKAKIQKLEQETSNIGRAVDKINKYLEAFFGRGEIQLKLDDEKKGYLIERDGKIAKNISEGERTAIAFSYFITKVQEKDFKVTEGIIIIDDPISSFDSNFIYHSFSIIKNHFKNSGQLFISTHNFEFFYLIKDWLKRKKKSSDLCEFYMLETIVEEDERNARILKLEDTLRNFKSEYHYLFFLLNQFVESTSTQYEKFYVIGNIARRFLEIFTNFKIPTTGDLLSKIGQLEVANISDVEKDKVYKLIQEFSHGSDPTSAIEHKDKSESKEAVRILLKIIQESDPKHFELLKKQI